MHCYSGVDTFYVRNKYASASYNGGVNFTPDMINGIPIPDGIDRKHLVKNVNTILDSMKVIGPVTSEVFAAIRSSANTQSLARLEKWYEMDAQKVLSELKRVGVNASVEERGEWVQLLDKQKARVAKPRAAIRQAELAINDAVNSAYKLSVAEIAIIEAS